MSCWMSAFAMGQCVTYALLGHGASALVALSFAILWLTVFVVTSARRR